MPANALAPPVALLSRFDARPWAATTVMSFPVAGKTITLTDYAVANGRYLDALSFLTGRGSQLGRDLAAEITVAWTGAAPTTITCGIDEDDRVWIESSAVDFSVEQSCPELGWSGPAFIVGGVAPFRQTADTEWLRGRQTNVGIKLLPVGGGGIFTAPSHAYTVQDVPTLLRPLGSVGDADDAETDCLEQAINTQMDLIQRRWRLGITSRGHIYLSSPTAQWETPTWASATFRGRLGFSGSEVAASYLGVAQMVADYPLPGALFPTRPLRYCRRVVGQDAHTLRLSGGAIASNLVGTYRGWDAALYVDGPVGSSRDLEEQLTERFFAYAGPGEPVTLYRHWGDPRRWLEARGATADLDAYGLLYTSEYRRGRLLCRRSPDDAERLTADYGEQGLDMWNELRIRLSDLVE